MEGFPICNIPRALPRRNWASSRGGSETEPPGTLVAFSWLYFTSQTVPSVEAFFYGINPVVVGLIVGDGWGLAPFSLL